jgi:hypothetical protein
MEVDMPNVSYWTGTWTGTDDMAPGDVHSWSSSGMVYGEATSVTAYPVTGNADDPDRVVEVGDVRMDGHPDGGLVLLFTVRNVGSTFIPAYLVALSSVTG